jgi:hypothetical protein
MRRVEALYGLEFWTDHAPYDLTKCSPTTGRSDVIGIVLLLIISFFLGVWYFVVSLAVFVLLSISDIPPSAKNNNATHVHTLISNIYKWHQTDSEGCRSYCIRERPSLMHLYGLVSQLP